MNTKKAADLILHNGHITTLDPKYPEAKSVAIKDGRIVGVDDAESYERGPRNSVQRQPTTLLPQPGERKRPNVNISKIRVEKHCWRACCIYFNTEQSVRANPQGD